MLGLVLYALTEPKFLLFFSLGYTTKRITLNTINFYFYFFLFVIWWYLPEVIFLVTYFVNKAIWWWFKLAHHIRQTNRICWITRWRVNSNKHLIYIHDIFSKKSNHTKHRYVLTLKNNIFDLRLALRHF